MSMKQKNNTDKENRKRNDGIQAQLLTNIAQIQNLSTNNALLNKKNMDLEETLKVTSHKLTTEIEALKFNKQILEERNHELIVAKRELQINYDTLQIKHETLNLQYESYRLSKEAEIEEIRQQMIQEKKEFEMNATSYANAIESYAKLQEENEKLTQEMQNTKKTYKSQIADIQKEKMLMVDSLKKEMIQKAFDMRNKALQIRKEQLDTTTRLTFLKNDQLARQLEYQSKSTEKIVFQNNELRQKLKKSEQDLSIFEELTKEFALRSSLSKKFVETLMKERNEEQKKNKTPDVSRINVGQRTESTTVQQLQQKVDYQQQIVVALDELLKKAQSKYQNLKLKHQESEKAKQKEDEEHKLSRVQCNGIVGILIKYLEITQETLAKEGFQSFDLRLLTQKHIDEWSPQNICRIVKVLLNFLRPHLSLKTLGLPYFKEKQKEEGIELGNEEPLNKKIAQDIVSCVKRKRNFSLEKLKTNSMSRKTNYDSVPISPGAKYNSLAQRFLRKKKL